MTQPLPASGTDCQWPLISSGARSHRRNYGGGNNKEAASRFLACRSFTPEANNTIELNTEQRNLVPTYVRKQELEGEGLR